MVGELAKFKGKEITAQQCEEFKIHLTLNWETKPAADKVVNAKNLTMYHIQDGINTYLKSLNDPDTCLRIKDSIPIDDSQFQIDQKPLNLLIL